MQSMPFSAEAARRPFATPAPVALGTAQIYRGSRNKASNCMQLHVVACSCILYPCRNRCYTLCGRARTSGINWRDWNMNESEIHHEIAPESKQNSLDQVLASQTFNRCAQLKRILRYVCSMDLEGRQEDITEYLIGVEALGRGSDF